MDPVVLTMRREPIRMARIQKCLRRDASHRHADPADSVALDEGDLRAFHTRVEGRHVPAGPAAEDRDVVRGH